MATTPQIPEGVTPEMIQAELQRRAQEKPRGAGPHKPMAQGDRAPNAAPKDPDFVQGFMKARKEMGADDTLTDDQDEQALQLKITQEALLRNLLSSRREAVAGRQSMGIEQEWLEDEEHYQGIDDANRAFHATNMLYRAQSKANIFGSAPVAPQGGTRSSIFINITRPYVDAASARVADMLLPTDDRAWEIRPTPVPKLTHGRLTALAGMLGLSDPMEAQKAIEDQHERTKQAAEKMQKQINDYLVESSFHGELRRVIEDCARLGSGVVKGPFPIKRTVRLTQTNPMTGLPQFMKVSDISPGSKRVDPWDFFPDPSCGENIQNGNYTWEREPSVSSRVIKEMIGMPGYDTEAIKQVLDEGPRISREGGESIARPMTGQNDYEMWIFYGNCTREQLEAMGVELDEDDANKLPTMAIIINDRLIKISQSPLEGGEFPYDVLAWQYRPGMPWGMGISRQIRTAQRMLNGAGRAMMDNSGLSASPQIILGDGVTPEDGVMALRPGKIWRLNPNASADDVRKAFAAFVVPSVQAELMAIINFSLKMAEDTTGMPAMLQGIRGDAPNTLGGMQMQNNNATSVLRRLARRFDDYVTRPHIQRYFDWIMVYDEDDSLKGDFQIEVRASSALLERDAQQNLMMQMISVSQNPIYRIDPAKLVTEIALSQRMDPKRFQYSDDEWEEMQQRMQQQNQAPTNPADEARAKLYDAQAAVQQARAGEVEASAAVLVEKAKQVQADTAARNVEGMFSATEAAKNLALAAPVAAAADAVWKSAGGKDHDAAPAIPSIESAPLANLAETGMPPLEVESNTNPLTPANPDSPTEGLRTGIEGGGGGSGEYM